MFDLNRMYKMPYILFHMSRPSSLSAWPHAHMPEWLRKVWWNDQNWFWHLFCFWNSCLYIYTKESPLIEYWKQIFLLIRKWLGLPWGQIFVFSLQIQALQHGFNVAISKLVRVPGDKILVETCQIFTFWFGTNERLL